MSQVCYTFTTLPDTREFVPSEFVCSTPMEVYTDMIEVAFRNGGHFYCKCDGGCEGQVPLDAKVYHNESRGSDFCEACFLRHL